jgi:2-hydroxycyclohexanecarboxyl-CoA dehydrogenase
MSEAQSRGDRNRERIVADRGLAVVSGAAGGIGAAVCQRLLADGFRIAALDIADQPLRELAGKAAGLSPYVLDQTDEAAVRTTVKRIASELGPIDALVNVLGWTQGTRFDQEGPAYWRQVVAINYEALLYIVHPILLTMIERKAGRMVFIASDAGRTGTAGQAVYAGAKGAVIAFAKSLARENARHNITVNCIAPGPTETPLFLKEQEEHPEMIQGILRAIPFRRAAKPAEQAAAVSFLLSADAGYITGQTLSVSGGLTMM